MNEDDHTASWSEIGCLFLVVVAIVITTVGTLAAIYFAFKK
jgi:hypothetical protein